MARKSPVIEPEPSAPPGLIVESLAIDGLHADPANVRKHPERNLDAIRASLARFGQQKPIVVDSDGVVRAGNGTLEAARALGWDRIDAVRSDLSAVELVAFSIADNRTAELAEWDDDALAATLRALQAEDFDLDAVGFSSAEVDAMFGDEPEEADGPAAEFGEFDGAADDGFVAFKFGDYSGRVGREVYDLFVAEYRARQVENGEPMLDDVLRGWLGV